MPATPRAILVKTLVSEYHTVSSLHVAARRAAGQLSQIPKEAAFKVTCFPPLTRVGFTDDISKASNESTSEALPTLTPTVTLTNSVRKRPVLTLQCAALSATQLVDSPAVYPKRVPNVPSTLASNKVKLDIIKCILEGSDVKELLELARFARTNVTMS